ncbi:hypothetical protein XENOCAPTIV_018155 [Xenoophorus captivus]|uniref:Uncharacterized protein n=1 Tax=Xenoophorus captivus TaxID=1517983 RepID=A0ABV0RHX1_9TELE
MNNYYLLTKLLIKLEYCLFNNEWKSMEGLYKNMKILHMCVCVWLGQLAGTLADEVGRGHTKLWQINNKKTLAANSRTDQLKQTQSHEADVYVDRSMDVCVW